MVFSITLSPTSLVFRVMKLRWSYILVSPWFHWSSTSHNRECPLYYIFPNFAGLLSLRIKKVLYIILSLTSLIFWVMGLRWPFLLHSSWIWRSLSQGIKMLLSITFSSCGNKLFCGSWLVIVKELNWHSFSPNLNVSIHHKIIKGMENIGLLKKDT